MILLPSFPSLHARFITQHSPELCQRGLMETGLQTRLWHVIYDSDGHTSSINVRMSPTGAVDGTRLNEGLCSIRVYGVCSFLSSKS
jgi:hypothetical protein